MSKKINITPADVKRMSEIGLCNDYGRLTKREIEQFCHWCNSHQLDPFLKEVYITKFEAKQGRRQSPATIITSYHVGFQKADNTGRFAGMSEIRYNEQFVNGELVYNTKAELERDNKKPITAHVTVSKLIGGNQIVPITASINCKEYNKTNSQWNRMYYTMLDKCVMIRALRFAFPNDVSATPIEEELAALNGNTEQAASLENVDRVVAPRDMVPGKQEVTIPPSGGEQDQEAADRAELLSTIHDMLADDVFKLEPQYQQAKLQSIWKSNKANWFTDEDIKQIFWDATEKVKQNQEQNEPA